MSSNGPQSPEQSPDRIWARELDARLAIPGAIDQGCFEEFLAAQHRLGLTHGDRPLCHHLRAVVISEARYREIARAAELVVAALARVATRALVDSALADAVGLTREERTLAAIDPGYPQLLAVGRLDMLVADDGFHVLELNADSPAGITDQRMINQALRTLPHARAMAADAGAPSAISTRAPHPERALLRALGEIFAAWGDGRRLRTIAIVDWRDADTGGELRAVAELFCAAGYHAVCVDPEQLVYAGGRLRFVDSEGTSEAIDMVYRRVITSELVARGGLAHPLIQAYRDRAVCVANSFRTKALNKKAALAVLSDPRHAALFSAEQRGAIAAHVPWTRRVQPAMLDELIARRDQLVLKPNDDYGGKGVLLGWHVDPAHWAAALSAAVAAAAGGDCWVVQERRRPGTVRLPTFRGQVTYEEVYFDLCPFLFAGRAEGAMVRVSSSPVSNVSAGGGIAALLIAGAAPGVARAHDGEEGYDEGHDDDDDDDGPLAPAARRV